MVAYGPDRRSRIRHRPGTQSCARGQSKQLPIGCRDYAEPHQIHALSSRSPYGGYRLSPWKAFERGATGCGFWCYAVGDQWRNRDMWREPSSLYAVIYTLEGAPPDISRAEKIIPSRRWEAWREGVEDYTWLWLLRQRGQDDPTARRTVDEAVRAVLAEPDDLALADAHRERLLRRLAERG